MESGFFLMISDILRLNLFLVSQMLNISCFENLLTTLYRWFCKLLPFAQLAHGACTVKLALETFQCSIDILSFFNGYN